MKKPPLFALALACLCALTLSAHARTLRVGLTEQHLKKDWTTIEAPFAEALEKVGHRPLVLPATTNEASIAAFLDQVDCVLLTGGADVDPARYGTPRRACCGKSDLVRDAYEFAVVAAARRRRLPIVGVCRGVQLMNVAFGGTLWQDIPSEFPAKTPVCHGSGEYLRPQNHPVAHTVRPVAGTRLAAVIGTEDLAVNSHHHQAVRDLAPGFRATAHSPDGVIEAIESTDYPAFGFQFHPEALVARAEHHPGYDFPRLSRLLRDLPRLWGNETADGMFLVGFDWSSHKATVSNATADCEFMRPVCVWRLTIDDDVWSEGSFDLYQLPPRGTAKVAVPFRRLPPWFAPAGYGVKRIALKLSAGGRVLDERTFVMPGKPQLFPPTPERFRFTGDILSKPYLQNAGTTGFTVCLETRRRLDDLRLVWTADGREEKTPFTFRKADFSGTFLARARVEGLKPGTRVSYEVAGEKGSFTTWKEGTDDFKCAVFGDFQSGLCNGVKWWDWEQDPFLCGERMFADMVASGCEFAVGTGDLADTADYKKEIRPLLIERTCGVMGSKIPFFVAFGNHDSIHPASHFFIENPVSDPSVSSFAFFRSGCLFVCIDDAEVGDDKRPGRPELRVWVEKLMSSEAARKAKFRFLFQHVPFYVEANGNCVHWIRDIAEKYGVDCVFSGDHHGYERITRGKTRQVVNGCMGYFDHGSEDVSGLVNWYGEETLAGGHRGMPKPTKWRFQAPGKPGVLGPETKVYEGLLPGYATLEVKGDTATWTLIAFNADGSKIGPVDSFTMKAGVRPDAPKGIALERYCYAQSPQGNWLLKYTLTGKGGRIVVKCEDDEWPHSRPIIEKDVVGVEFTNAKGQKKSYRLLPDNTIRED